MSQERSIFEEKNDVRMPFRYGTVEAYLTIRSLSINGFHHFGINLSGTSLWVPIGVIAFVFVPYIGRPLRGQVLALRNREFVEAATAQGAGPIRIMFTELLPNIASSVLVLFR